MARKTRLETESTHAALLDAAERVFQEKGVAASTLNDIAQAAGMTRGAIYWHFKDKSELVHAMCERATLPMEAMFNEITAVAGDDPLGSIRKLTVHALSQVAVSKQQQTVFDIMFHKCEKTGDHVLEITYNKDKANAGEVLSLVQANAKIKFWDYQARFDHKLGQNANYTAFAYGSFDSIGDKISPEPFLQFEFYRVQQRIKQQLPRGGTANYSLAFGLDKSGVTTIKTNEWQIAPRIDVRIPLGERSNGEFGFGIDQEFQIFRVDAASGNANFVENIGVVLSDRFVSATGLYAELLWRKGPVDIRPGVRTDIYAQVGPSAVLPQATAITHAIGVDPRLLLRETLNARWVLRQNIGVYHQAPSFPVPIPGVESFGFERGLQRNIQGSVGYEFTVADKFILTQDAYLGRLDNLQDYDLAAATTGSFSEFDDVVIRAKGTVYGLETMLRLAPRQRVYGWAAYTLSRSTRKFEQGGNAPSNWDQRHILNIVLGYRIGEKWNIGGRLHFNTGRPYTAMMAGQSAAEALTYNRNNKRLPAFFQLDLRAERTWRFRTWNLQLIIDVLNSTYAREVYACVLTTGNFNLDFGGNPAAPGSQGCTQQGIRYILPSIGLRGVF